MRQFSAKIPDIPVVARVPLSPKQRVNASKGELIIHVAETFVNVRKISTKGTEMYVEKIFLPAYRYLVSRLHLLTHSRILFSCCVSLPWNHRFCVLGILVAAHDHPCIESAGNPALSLTLLIKKTGEDSGRKPRGLSYNMARSPVSPFLSKNFPPHTEYTLDTWDRQGEYLKWEL